MTNLTELWIAAGKPEGRRPSNFKATAAVKRQLEALDDMTTGWSTVGRGAKSVTYASDALAAAYAIYLLTAKRRSTKATSTGASTGATTGTRTGTTTSTYTADDMQRAYNSGRSNGYTSGYEAGLREGASRSGSSRQLNDVRAYVNSHERGRKAFSRRFHPDLHQSTPQANANMAFINNFFDDLEKIFNHAA